MRYLCENREKGIVKSEFAVWDAFGCMVGDCGSGVNGAFGAHLAADAPVVHSERTVQWPLPLFSYKFYLLFSPNGVILVFRALFSPLRLLSQVYVVCPSKRKALFPTYFSSSFCPHDNISSHSILSFSHFKNPHICQPFCATARKSPWGDRKIQCSHVFSLVNLPKNYL